MRFLNCSYRKKLPEGGEMRQTAISSPCLPVLLFLISWNHSACESVLCSISGLFCCKARQGSQALTGDESSQGWTVAAASSMAPRGPASSAGAWGQHRPSVLSFPNLSFPSSPLHRQSSAASQAQEVIRLDWNQTSVPVSTAVPKHHRATQAHPERGTPSLSHFCLPSACKVFRFPHPLTAISLVSFFT